MQGGTTLSAKNESESKTEGYAMINTMKAIVLTLIASSSLVAAPEPLSDAPTPSTSTNSRARLPSGPDVLGVFEGRSPCQDIAGLLNAAGREACTKIKWRLILYHDPVTHAPTTYALAGFMWRTPPRTGKWTVVKGTPIDSNATVYQLDPEDPKGFLSFVKADDNILFFLDKDRNLLIGNIKHSYTLNRVGR
jgi:hypothetical protein